MVSRYVPKQVAIVKENYILILEFKGLVCLFDPESLGLLLWSSVQTEWNSFDLLQTVQYSCLHLHQTEWNLQVKREKINRSENMHVELQNTRTLM